MKIEGVYPALLTPMNFDESVDTGGVRALVAWLLERGVHGIFAAGTHGEAYAVDREQRGLLIATVVDEVAGRVPVTAGAGAITTRQSIDFARDAQRAGADAISLVTPYFIAPRQEELRQHFLSVAESVEIPSLIYNLPGRTGVSVEPETLARLSESAQIIGVKDSSGDLGTLTAYLDSVRQPFYVMNGNDNNIAAALRLGACGCVAASANVAPALVVSIYEHARAGRDAEAAEAQRKLARIRRLFSAGTVPGVMKEMARLLGLPVGRTAAPILRLAPAVREEMARVMDEVGLERFEAGSEQ